MNNFVISLRDNNEKRRTHITEQFSSKDVPFEFFDAITKTQLHVADDLGITFGESKLTDNEKGCLLSHVSIWKKVIDENLPYAGVFEDDIYLSKESGSFLSNYDWVDTNWHVVKIERADEKVKTSLLNLNSLNNKGIIYKLKDEHLCAGGYVITNAGARYLFDKIKNYDITEPIDYEIFDNYIMDSGYIVCQFIPALCIQDFTLNKSYENLSSSLVEGRVIKEKPVKEKHKNKLLRELLRIWNTMTDAIVKKQKQRKLPFNL